MNDNHFDWADLAFASKKALSELNAVFIPAPRSISATRFTQLVKELLPQGNILLGLAKESHIVGFENQPQFTTLQFSEIQAIVTKVAQAQTPHKIYTLSYFQRELPFILEKVALKKTVWINGSWQYSFHTNNSFYTLVQKKVPYQLVSPFSGEDEAKEYSQKIESTWSSEVTRNVGTQLTSDQLMAEASRVAKFSFDHTFQTGAVLAQQQKSEVFEVLAVGYNAVVPYPAYALHHGAARETHFSPPQDLNHYDTVHAEVMLLIQAQKQKINLAHTTVAINLLPCPTCSRMIAATDIAEIFYQVDHSDGYAVKMLEAAGKRVERLV